MFSTFSGFGDGYVVIDSNSTYYIKDAEAKIRSHLITGPVCMKFYFYLHGNETGSLTIETITEANNKEIVFHRYGNHGHRWTYGQVYLSFGDADAYQVLYNNMTYICIFIGC